MRTILACGAAVLALGLSLRAADPKELAGDWQLVAAQREGNDAPDLVGHLLSFRGDKFVVRKGDKVLFEGTFKTDNAKKPAQIDFEHTKDPLAGKKWLGIYAIEDGVLKICDNSEGLDKPRPTAFAAKPGSGSFLGSFKRAKP